MSFHFHGPVTVAAISNSAGPPGSNNARPAQGNAVFHGGGIVHFQIGHSGPPHVAHEAPNSVFFGGSMKVGVKIDCVGDDSYLVITYANRDGQYLLNDVNVPMGTEVRGHDVWIAGLKNELCTQRVRAAREAMLKAGVHATKHIVGTVNTF